MESLRSIFGPGGLLERGLPGFVARAQQAEMADAVATAIDERAELVAEAATGTGKSYAYLVPALLSGTRVIVSTATRTLQDQLHARDLPSLRTVLGVPGRVALLKGRANYLCLHRLAIARVGERFRTREQAARVAAIDAWAGHTASGDIAEFEGTGEDDPVWPLVTSTTDNCLGSRCEHLRDCHVMRARRVAGESDLVVVNHHLLFADLALREEGFGELLPGAGAFILDEAHQVPEIAAGFFGTSVGSRQLLDLVRDVTLEQQREAREAQAVADALRHTETAVRELNLALGERELRDSFANLGAAGLPDRLAELRGRLRELGASLDTVAPRGPGLDKCGERVAGLADTLARFELEDADDVRWADVRRRGFALHRTPLDVSGILAGLRASHPVAWIHTSATLAVGDSFGHFLERCGLPEATTARRWDSPFDYARQSLLYVPSDLPDPSSDAHTEAVCRLARRLLDWCGGGMFLLFTSHRALRRAAELMDGLAQPVWVQGSAPRNELLARFREHGDAVLLGTGSFWEGVDVRGTALRCVIIDKLPFAAPNDPVLRARLDMIRRRGAEPFTAHQLPTAALSLKQGAGRLIRSTEDTGVLVIGDQRLVSKGYGRVLRASLPPMPMTRDAQAVRAFFAAQGHGLEAGAA